MKILINYFIDYKNYNLVKYKYHYNENDINIFEFIKMRNEIYNKISILIKFNFTQNSKLSIETRNYQDYYMKNN